MAHLTRPAEISGVSAGSFPETAAGNRAYATDRGDKINESSVVASCVHFRQQVAATKYK